jgi:hypothetical protein
VDACADPEAPAEEPVEMLGEVDLRKSASVLKEAIAKIATLDQG